MKQILKYVAGMALVVAMVVALGQIGIARSQATPAQDGTGCETVGWGLNFFGNWTQRRTICDGPRRADGSWDRARVVWTPAGYVPRSTYCGSFSCTSSGGYYRDESVQEATKYVVFDSNVLPNEPGWLPLGTNNIMVR